MPIRLTATSVERYEQQPVSAATPAGKERREGDCPIINLSRPLHGSAVNIPGRFQYYVFGQYRRAPKPQPTNPAGANPALGSPHLHGSNRGIWHHKQSVGKSWIGWWFAPFGVWGCEVMGLEAVGCGGEPHEAMG